ncbi:NUDIX hydrolase [Candidatus Enterococcus ikei]|uniref:NUDIX hydrolase N-terminal domain-containing protein n=1 Tax=Candidatus Enterococcus ikei TaxID=2815326 RepID=A0ABS3GUZ0_9ENTE|nr:NUDIX hydrolase N-terminal domain-containing protein [Enterococcus sp. DIV0869a]MBO0439068.1 NUDIX hydrolase N-terminal domain-containing protein [Enterococcus sp. DIV0869a]
MEKELSMLLTKLQGIAQTGKKYGKDIFDQERYEELSQVTKQLMRIIYPVLSEQELSIIIDKDEGYATPKVDVRAVVFNKEGKLLLVKEKSDNCWSLPGGWADIGYSPKEIAEKETLEEAGVIVKAQRLIAVLDKAKHEYPAALTYVYKLFIRCEVQSDEPKAGIETSEVGYFSLQEISMLSLSEERNILENFKMIFNDYENEKNDTICD